jgi:penicillin-insensitive murein endopeptidase
MPSLSFEHRVVGLWVLGLALPLGLVALAASAATAERPIVAVSRAPVVAGFPAPVDAPSGALSIEPVTIRPERHPLDGLSPLELATRVRTTPGDLGTAIVGRPNRGKLLNPVRLESGAGLEVMNDERCFATPATASSIRAAVAEIERDFPGSLLRVGDISSRRGGYIRPHRSHQAGVDADIGFYYLGQAKWYTKANASNLDRERTWALVKALVRQGTVEYLFVDRSIQVLLREHALAIGEPREFVETLFESPAKKDTLIRHTWGHLTHFHVRFIDPVAEETGRRVAPTLERGVRAVKPTFRAKKK